MTDITVAALTKDMAQQLDRTKCYVHALGRIEPFGRVRPGYCSWGMPTLRRARRWRRPQQLYGDMADAVECVSGHCDAEFNAKLLSKLTDAYPDPITVNVAS
jgi:hypothetical protein